MYALANIGHPSRPVAERDFGGVDMRLSNRFRTRLTTTTALATLCVCSSLATDQSTAQTKSQECSSSDSGLKLPAGFCATVFADNIGHARHLVVAPNGVVYVNTWSGRYYGNDQPPAGGFLLALQDTKGEGRADIVTRYSAADG